MKALIIAMLVVLPIKGTILMSSDISVSVSSGQTRALLGGPVPVVISVVNANSRAVDILLPYPNPSNLQFECVTKGIAAARTVDMPENERSLPITIGGGKRYDSIYYLNRYLIFQKAGRPMVRYRLTIPVLAEGPAKRWQDADFHGEFELELVEGTEGELRARLAQYSDELKGAGQRRLEAAEALAFLDTPVSVEYVAPMLSIKGLEVTGIRALARFPSPLTYGLIAGMLSHKESDVVAATLEELSRLRVPIERTKIRQLLSSVNPNIRCLALEWLSTSPDHNDLPAIRSLTNDQNPAVRKLATSYASQLTK